MNRGKGLLYLVLALGCSVVFTVPVSAHSAFKKQLASKYPNMKVSCNACHVKQQPKTVRNNYGQLFSKTFENKTLTADWKAKKGPMKKEFEKAVMVPAFDAAFEKIKVMTLHDLIEAGVIDGITSPEPAEGE